MKGLFKNCWTIPNLLTLIRILLVPVFAVLFYRGYYIAAVAVLVVSGLTDTFDGKIARRFNQISDLGKVLDPVADKLTQITLAILLFIKFRGSSKDTLVAFSWIFLVFLIKEAIMVIGGAALLALNLRPSPAESFGKIATFAFYAVMTILIAFAPDFGAFSKYFVLPDWVLVALVAISAVFTLVAFLGYLPGTIKQFATRQNPEPNRKKK